MKDDLFAELLSSVKEGADILKGRRAATRTIEFANPDVRNIRNSYGLTQEEFARMLGISVATLRNWEQGRRRPEGPARVLLQVAARHPEAILESVRAETSAA